MYTALAGKANSSHTHNIADVTGLQSALDGKQATLTSSTALGGVNGKTLNYGGAVSLTGGDIPLSAGSSTNVSGAISLINNNLGQKQDALTFGTGLTLNGNIVTVDTAAAVASGDTGYTTGAQVATALAGKANASHTHAIADVTGLQSVLNDLQNDKQDELVSGTSIKTINGESVLGSGNISADTVVSVTETTNGQITSYTSDMTPAEVRTALTAGKEVVYKVSSASGTSYSYYQVVSYNLVGITATKINGTASETLVHTSSGVSVSSTTLATSTDVSGKQDAIASGTATIAVSDWSSNSCTVTATGVTASNTVIVSPDSASITDYAAAGVQCTAQGANTLTFTCTTTPTSSLTINYLAL